MKNETVTISTANVQSAPAVRAEGLKVSFSVIVDTDNGQNALRVEGGFNLPSALHRAMRYDAETDFEVFLTRSIVNTAKNLLAQFMWSVAEAENLAESVRNKGDDGAKTANVPSPQTASGPTALQIALKEIPREFSEPKLPPIPVIAGGQLVAA